MSLCRPPDTQLRPRRLAKHWTQFVVNLFAKVSNSGISTGQNLLRRWRSSSACETQSHRACIVRKPRSQVFEFKLPRLIQPQYEFLRILIARSKPKLINQQKLRSPQRRFFYCQQRTGDFAREPPKALPSRLLIKGNSPLEGETAPLLI
jgi:hypothetical protein